MDLMDSLVPSSVMETSAALFTQLHCQIHSRPGKTHLPNEVGMNIIGACSEWGMITLYYHTSISWKK